MTFNNYISVSFVITTICVHKKLLESKDLKAAVSCKRGRRFYWIRTASGKKLNTWKGNQRAVFVTRAAN
jgi:hypothetical protein